MTLACLLLKSKQVLCYNGRMDKKNNESNQQIEEMVHSPNHYNKLVIHGEHVETIEFINSFLNMNKELTPYQGMLMGTVLKYLSRYPFKGKPIEDLEKAECYLKWLIDDLKVVTKSEDKRGKI